MRMKGERRIFLCTDDLRSVVACLLACACTLGSRARQAFVRKPAHPGLVLMEMVVVVPFLAFALGLGRISEGQ